MTAIIDKLAWIHIQNRKILLTRSYGKTLFYLPGGKREAGESDQQALLREIQEELSVALQADSLRYAQTFRSQADGKAEGIDVQLTCYFGQADGLPQASSEIEQLAWVDSSNQQLCSLAALQVFHWLKQQDLID
ncbi:NUDIX hydrolase [Celerinatantimonas sp. YJH-8]|uniref:NUDIX hydrolase n=1 Tax=Celerinatantimonas sp. YJH-8 TaxID=3228714 RepID=UPI0038C812B4